MIRIRNTGKYNISASLNFPSFLSLKFSFQKYGTGTYRRIKLSFIFTKQMSPLPPDLRFLPAPLNCFSIRLNVVNSFMNIASIVETRTVAIDEITISV